MFPKLFFTALGFSGIVVTTERLIIHFTVSSIFLLIIFSFVFAYGFMHLKEDSIKQYRKIKSKLKDKFQE